MVRLSSTFSIKSYLNFLVQFTECLRYYPLVILERSCTKEWKVPGTEYVVKPGDLVQIPSSAIMRDSAYFPDAKNFNPEVNFSEESKSDRYEINHSQSFI